MKYIVSFLVAGLLFSACSSSAPQHTVQVKPSCITETVAQDSDDPAFWVNRQNTAESMILGTDKGGDAPASGGVYVFSLDGKIDRAKSVTGLDRPNNIDVAYDLPLAGGKTDIAVFTERGRNMIRVYRLPEMKPIDGGGIPVFPGEIERSPMGIALYTRPSDGSIFAIVGRKSGPSGSYLWQYQLEGQPDGTVKGVVVRKFGTYSGNKEIESIAVDNELGFVYYSDEGVGVRKYHADPARQDNQQLALFATKGFAQDHEGISIYKANDGTGYILVSDQQANAFHVFSRNGTAANPHDHQLIKIVYVSTDESDGSDVCNIPLNAQYPNGMFVAMSTDKTFQFYRWEDIAGKELFLAPAGLKKPM